MQQMYSCPNCYAALVYSQMQRFCDNCGMQLNWTVPQTAFPSVSQSAWQQRQYPNHQSAWSQSNSNVLQYGWSQGTTLNQPSSYNPASGYGYPYHHQQQYEYDNGNSSSQSKSSLFGMALLLLVMFIFLVVGGIAVATNGAFFSVSASPTAKSFAEPVSTSSQSTVPSTMMSAPTSVSTLSVEPPPVSLPVITSFTASPSTVAAGQSSTLQWNVTGASSVSIDQGIGNVSPGGTKPVTPATTTTYTITATNGSGSAKLVATINVNPASPVSPTSPVSPAPSCH